MLLSSPCYLEEIVIFAQNMHQKLFFQAPNAKFSLPPLGRFAPSQCSSKFRSLGFSKPPPPKNFWLRACDVMNENIFCDIMRQELWRYEWEIFCDIMRQELWRYEWEKLWHYALVVTLQVRWSTHNVTIFIVVTLCVVVTLLVGTGHTARSLARPPVGAEKEKTGRWANLNKNQKKKKKKEKETQKTAQNKKEIIEKLWNRILLPLKGYLIESPGFAVLFLSGN